MDICPAPSVMRFRLSLEQRFRNALLVLAFFLNLIIVVFDAFPPQSPQVQGSLAHTPL